MFRPIWALILGGFLLVSMPLWAAFPSPELLAELKQRLEKPPACMPSCAAIDLLEIEAGERRLSMRLQVNAEESVALPMPVREGEWWPTGYLIDGKSNPSMLRDPKGLLWTLVPAGRHSIELNGPLPQRSQLDLPLPLPPARVEVKADQWAANGLDENGVPAQQIQLIRKQQLREEEGTKGLEPGILPPLLQVRRTLHLGLEWGVQTEVRRLSPAGSPVTLRLPLLPGEAVTSTGFEVEDGKLLLRMPAAQSFVSFSSSMKPVETMQLKAPDDPAWTEVWQLDVAPIWHVEYQGIPIIHHQDGRGAWMPTWAPYPGEEVTLSISRPPGVPGNWLTIDYSSLQVTPGQRSNDSQLSLALRASQGGQHKVLLPQGAALQQVRIDGRSQPIRQEGQGVTLPIHPGLQQIDLDWRTEGGIRNHFVTPLLDLGLSSVNHAIQVKMGQDRWTLVLVGPLLGPAVLFWSVLLIIGLLSLLLGRLALTPLQWHQWLLLGVGLSQVGVLAGVIIVGWLLALGLRDRRSRTGMGSKGVEMDATGTTIGSGDEQATAVQQPNPLNYNLMQIGLLILTLMALNALFDAVSAGLLGQPDMQIAGNGSSGRLFNWYQDQVAAQPDRATIISVPLLYYRLAMMAWALWLAFALLRWLRWGWQVFARDGLLKNVEWKIRKPEPSTSKKKEDKKPSADGWDS